MRRKDDNKYRAICDAAIGLITRNGFADTSMSKIAKAAGVSPATIYVYFENKEELLNELYLLVKREMSVELLLGVREGMPVTEAFKILWDNFYNYAIGNQLRFAFTEQFANSPLVENCHIESMEYFQPILALFRRGVEEKVFKEISLEIFIAFTIAALTVLIKEQFSGRIVLDRETLDKTFQIAWDAVTI